MKLKDIVNPQAVVVGLGSVSRDEAIGQLLDALVSSGVADASLRDELMQAVLDREKKGSTGFGRGVAVPHVKHAGVTGLAAAVGLSETGVDFTALDKQPVYSIFLLLSPADSPEEHLQAMEIVFKNLSNEIFRRFLRQASTPEEVMTLLDDADNQQLAS